jgi:uncharacterized protein (TIGR02466 family)
MLGYGKLAMVGKALLARPLRGSPPPTVSDPERFLAWLVDYAQEVLSLSPGRPSDAAAPHLLAWVLMDFLANPPKRLVRVLRSGTGGGAAHPWQYASRLGWQGLDELVQDVWEHLFGPEANSGPAILRAILEAPLGRVMDYGAGAGRYAVPLAQAGIFVDAVEASAVKRLFLARVAERLGCTEHLSVGRRVSTYQTILCINVLDHHAQPAKALRGLTRALEPGGLLIHWSLFPQDCGHRHTPRTIGAAARTILSEFTPVANGGSTAQRLEVLVRCKEAKSSGVSLLRLHPTVHADSGGPFDLSQEKRTLRAPCFYVKPTLLQAAEADLLLSLRGNALTFDSFVCFFTERGIYPTRAMRLVSTLVKARILIGAPSFKWRSARGPFLTKGGFVPVAAARGERIARYEAIAAARSGDPLLLYNWGTLLLEDGRAAEAISVLRRGTLLDPFNAELHLNLGLAQRACGDEQGAFASFQTALSVQPSSTLALANLIASAWNVGRCQLARDLCGVIENVVVLELACSLRAADLAAFNAGLAQEVLRLPSLRENLHGKATRGGWQSADISNLDFPHINRLKSLVWRAAMEFIVDIGLTADLDLALGMWAVVLHRKGYQVPHIHPDGLVSGVYYIDKPLEMAPGAGSLEFLYSPTSDNAVATSVAPNPGRLVLFPSYLWHRTLPTTAQQRLSIAFDIMPRPHKIRIGGSLRP